VDVGRRADGQRRPAPRLRPAPLDWRGLALRGRGRRIRLRATRGLARRVPSAQ